MLALTTRVQYFEGWRIIFHGPLKRTFCQHLLMSRQRLNCPLQLRLQDPQGKGVNNWAISTLPRPRPMWPALQICPSFHLPHDMCMQLPRCHQSGAGPGRAILMCRSRVLLITEYRGRGRYRLVLPHSLYSSLFVVAAASGALRVLD